jgi:purine-binding chemotaxis protein CheW
MGTLSSTLSTQITFVKLTMDALLVRVHSWFCALPLSVVVETMRALDIRRLDNAPGFIRGLSIIRGKPLPVVDLTALLGTEAGQGGRLVLARAGERHLALAVDEVLGIRRLDDATLTQTPPLVASALSEGVEKIGPLDGEALAMIEVVRLVPAAVWDALQQAR